RFGIRSYFKKELNYTNKQKFKDLRKADLLVLFSGGYFGEREGSLKENILRFVRYVSISFWFIFRKKLIVFSCVCVGHLIIKICKIVPIFLLVYYKKKTNSYFWCRWRPFDK